MKGKSSFNKREVELIESLILQRCNADKSQQKNIRSKMRNLGFYGSDYGVKDMTIEKFHGLIESGQIKVLDAGQVISKPAVKSVICKNAERSLSLKNGLEAWVGENPMGGNGVRHLCAHCKVQCIPLDDKWIAFRMLETLDFEIYIKIGPLEKIYKIAAL